MLYVTQKDERTHPRLRATRTSIIRSGFMRRYLKAWTDLRVLPAAVWSLCVATFVNRLGGMGLPFLTLYLVRSAHLDVTTAGAILAVYGGVALVVGPIAGRLCDRFGPSRVMIGALGAAGVALCIYPLARTTPALVFLTALWALSAETFRPASMVLLTSVVPPENRKQAFALHRLAGNLGMSVGPAAAGFIAEISFPAIFVVDGATALLATATLLATYRKDVAFAKTGPRRWLPFDALADPKLVMALSALFLLAVLFMQNDSSIPLVLVRDHHFAPAVYGAMFTLNTLLIVACEIPLNAWIAHWPHRRVLALGALIAGLGLAGVIVARSIAQLAAMVVVWTIGEMLYSPGIATYVAEIAPAHRRGDYLGLFSMTYVIGFIAAPWAGLSTLEHEGTTALAFGMLLLGLVAAVIFSRIEQAPALAGVARESAE